MGHANTPAKTLGKTSVASKIAAVLASILLASTVGCASKPTEPTQFTVLTYNIHHAAGVDGKLDLARIAGIIKQTNPDFVALQEVDRKTTRTGKVDQAAELGKLTGMHAAFGKAMSFMGGQYGDAVLCRFPIQSHRVIDLPWTDESKHEPRCALVTRCKTPAGEVAFISTHLDHTNRPNDRVEQVKAIIEKLTDEKSPAILAGDFNCRPGSEPLLLLDAQWRRMTDDVPSIPSVDPKEKIDHIYAKPPARWKVIETRVINEEVASDHRPVVAKIELQPTGPVAEKEEPEQPKAIEAPSKPGEN